MMTSTSITAISWERVHLSLTALLSGYSGAAESVQFVIADGERVFPVKTTPTGDRQYRIDINVTNFRNRDQVPNATWRFIPLVDGDVAVGLLPAAGYDLKEGHRLTRTPASSSTPETAPPM
jgi:CDP-ribitol ribitolphosphotransferase / teichoic acid ribitol-phosphate polymerase